MEKVVLGLSDGVDSAVSAKLLQAAGYDVYGLYLDIGGERAKSDARSSAAHLGIPLRVADIGAELEKRVCAPFAAAYLRGETPSPCIGCNPTVKLPALLRYADEIGAAKIATGHYARCEDGKLYMGCPDNDQSYMLCRVTRAQAENLLLPLGEYDKARVRELARAWGIPVANKPDSREICFIKNMTYAEWIEARAGAPGPGDCLFEGRAVGRHEGIHRYTVGQRWGENENGRRLYVSRILPETNQLELALWDDLFTREVAARDLNWLTDPPKAPFEASVRVRHTRWETPDCTVIPTPEGVRIVARTPLRAPAKGQAAALYIQNRLIGGGYIT